MDKTFKGKYNETTIPDNSANNYDCDGQSAIVCG